MEVTTTHDANPQPTNKETTTMSEAESGKLYTLTQVSQKTKISMPTLQRYKKLYQNRIPSSGSGRSQRYPADALDVFLQLKEENVKKRGRPRKADSAGAAKKVKAAKAPARRGRPKKAAPAKAKAAKAAKPSGKLLTLTEISKLTTISYPTLLRYVKSNLKDIPHQGEGRSRRFKPGAVEVFKRLRGESKRGPGRPAAVAKPVKRRGRPPKKAAAAAAAPTGRRRGRPPKSASEAAVSARLKQLETANKQLERKLAKLEKQLHKPLKVVLQR